MNMGEHTDANGGYSEYSTRVKKSVLTGWEKENLKVYYLIN
jgi:hypothetical protein